MALWNFENLVLKWEELSFKWGCVCVCVCVLVGGGIFSAECNSKKFGLYYFLVYQP